MLAWQLMGGRCTAAFYTIMGIPDCTATDFDDYVDIAVRLGACIVWTVVP